MDENLNPFLVDIGRKFEITIAIDGVELEEKIRIGLFDSVVPITSDNFYQLCVHNFYDNTPFHRIIPNFMMQGGDFTDFNGFGGYAFKYKPDDPDNFEDENFKIRFATHVLAMANNGPNTNGSEFFITTNDPFWLDGMHVVFGRMINSKELDTYITKTIESYGSESGKTVLPVTLVKCQEIKENFIQQDN